jgi:hypothetical protein
MKAHNDSNIFKIQFIITKYYYGFFFNIISF